MINEPQLIGAVKAAGRGPGAFAQKAGEKKKIACHRDL